MPLSRIGTAAGDWLTAAQNAAQSQNGDTLFLKLTWEEVIFIWWYVAYDRLVRPPRPTRNGC